MSKTMSWDRKAKIRKGEPIELLGLTFYPIKMAHYEEFLDVRNALVLRMTSLPVAYISMPFISALWAIEVDGIKQHGGTTGIFERVIRFLYLSLRLEYKAENAFKTIYCNSQTPREFKGIEIAQGDKNILLTPVEFEQVRQLLADQNGLEIPDESYNPELVQAEKDIADKAVNSLEFDTDNLISSVAYASRLQEKDIDEWTVLQFERRRAAIDRDKHFMLYGQAELTGFVKFKKGNPYPSWCFDKKQGLTSALRTMDEMGKRTAALGDIGQVVAAETAKQEQIQRQSQQNQPNQQESQPKKLQTKKIFE